MSHCMCETPQNVRNSAKCGRCGLPIDLMARLEDSLSAIPKPMTRAAGETDR